MLNIRKLISFLFASVLFLSFSDSLFLGFIMASISPAVVIPLSNSMNISEKLKSNLIVESTITDVLSIFFVIAFYYEHELKYKINAGSWVR